jgi:L-seryl-tRNA(Ser) seleniumtransferase
MQVGFTETVPARRLAALARQAGVPLIVDQGSGNLHELGPYGLGDEATVASVLEEGADLVTFSGDKLLGGPQAGIIVGESALIEQLSRNALARALRPDKLILAALIATLADHESGRAFDEIPVLRRLTSPPAVIGERVEVLCGRLAEAGIDRARLEVREGTTRSGGGSSPEGALPTVLLCLEPGPGGEADLAARLRQSEPAVVGRLAEGRLVLDLRTIDPEEDELLAETLLRALGHP